MLASVVVTSIVGPPLLLFGLDVAGKLEPLLCSVRLRPRTPLHPNHSIDPGDDYE